MYDYHVHSSFSADCDIDMKDFIEKAINMGFKEICFTDHIDYDYCDPSINFEFDIADYTEYINKMRGLFGHKIKILKGVEIGIQPHLLKDYEDTIGNNNFDFVISSIHTCDRKDLYLGDFYKDKTPRQAYLKYFEELLYCIKNFDSFNVIGHLDVLIRYDEAVRNENIRNYFDVLEEIFKALIDKNKGIEINTSGYRYNLDSFMPSFDIVKLYKELGGEIITVGSDSHSPDTLGFKFDHVYEALKHLGFKYITIFEKMEPNFIKI